MQPVDPKALAENQEDKAGSKKGGESTLRLPTTTVAGIGKKKKSDESEAEPSEDQVEQAVDKPTRAFSGVR